MLLELKQAEITKSPLKEKNVSAFLCRCITLSVLVLCADKLYDAGETSYRKSIQPHSPGVDQQAGY